jgi:hypothetical protein
MEGTMRAPIPTPEGLPAQAAIIIMGCLFVFLSALWLFVITKAMIAIGVGVVALSIAGGLCLRSSLCAEATVTIDPMAIRRQWLPRTNVWHR